MHLRGRRRKKRMRSKTASIPYGIWMAIFIVVPMILVVIFAFTDKAAGSRWKYRSCRTVFNVFALHLAGCNRHRDLPAGGVSAGLYHLTHRRTCAKRTGDVGDAAHVDELFAAHLCVDDALGGQRHHQYGACHAGIAKAAYDQYVRRGGAGHGL